MKLSWLALVGLTAVCVAADTKQSLEQARAQYQQAVHQHGRQSPEAIAARKSLRESRRAYHTERRQREQNRNKPHQR